jgi:hypothetical protein
VVDHLPAIQHDATVYQHHLDYLGRLHWVLAGGRVDDGGGIEQHRPLLCILYKGDSGKSAGTPHEVQADPLGVLRFKGHRERLPVGLASVGRDSELDVLALAIVITEDACPARREPDTEPEPEPSSIRRKRT